MDVVFPKPFSEMRSYISKGLPELVFKTNADKKIGGGVYTKIVETFGIPKWRMIVDSAEEVQLTVPLGKSSNRLSLGLRRIMITARPEGSTTVVTIEEYKNTVVMAISVMFGLALCVIPGVMWMAGNSMHTTHNRHVIQAVVDELRRGMPGVFVRGA